MNKKAYHKEIIGIFIIIAASFIILNYFGNINNAYDDSNNIKIQGYVVDNSMSSITGMGVLNVDQKINDLLNPSIKKTYDDNSITIGNIKYDLPAKSSIEKSDVYTYLKLEDGQMIYISGAGSGTSSTNQNAKVQSYSKTAQPQITISLGTNNKLTNINLEDQQYFENSDYQITAIQKGYEVSQGNNLIKRVIQNNGKSSVYEKPISMINGKPIFSREYLSDGKYIENLIVKGGIRSTTYEKSKNSRKIIVKDMNGKEISIKSEEKEIVKDNLDNEIGSYYKITSWTENGKIISNENINIENTKIKAKYDQNINSLKSNNVLGYKQNTDSEGNTIIDYNLKGGIGLNINGQSSGDRIITTTINDQKFKVDIAIMGDVYTDDSGNKYKLTSNQKACGSTGYCLKTNDARRPIINLNKDQYESLSDIASTNRKTESIVEMIDVKKNKEYYLASLQNEFYGDLSKLLEGYLDEWLGTITYNVPASVCDDNMHRGDKGYAKDRVMGIKIPQTSWESDRERELLNNVETIIASGEVEKITDSMFRYQVNVKFVGAKDTGQWFLYLRNSCDNHDSNKTWYDEGMLSYHQVYQDLYAGQSGEDMIFEAGVDDYYKFDEVVVYLVNQTREEKFKLAGSDIFGSELCH